MTDVTQDIERIFIVKAKQIGCTVQIVSFQLFFLYTASTNNDYRENQYQTIERKTNLRKAGLTRKLQLNMNAFETIVFCSQRFPMGDVTHKNQFA